MPEQQQDFKFWSLKEFAEKYLEIYSEGNKYSRQDLLLFSTSREDALYLVNHRDFNKVSKQERDLYQQMVFAYEYNNYEALKNFSLVGLFIQFPTVGNDHLMADRWSEAQELINAQKISPKLAEVFLETMLHATFVPREMKEQATALKTQLSKTVDREGNWIPTRYVLKLKAYAPNATNYDLFEYAKSFDLNEMADRIETEKVIQDMKDKIKDKVDKLGDNATEENIKHIFADSENMIVLLNHLIDAVNSPEVAADYEKRRMSVPGIVAEIRKHIEEIKSQYDPIKFLEKQKKLKALKTALKSDVSQEKPQQIQPDILIQQSQQNGMK